jgi:hypothetical protein
MEFDKFKTLLDNLLEKEQGSISTNYGDCYYYEYWSIEKLENGKLEVGFDIGSGSGWIPTDLEFKEVTYEELHQLFVAQDDLGELSMLNELSCHYDRLNGTITKQENESN